MHQLKLDMQFIFFYQWEISLEQSKSSHDSNVYEQTV